MAFGTWLSLLGIALSAVMWIIPPARLNYEIGFYIVVLAITLIISGPISAVHRRMSRRKRNKKDLYFIVENGDPWVQSILGAHDYRRNIRTPGTLFTYRIALGNRSDRMIRDVEIKLTSIRPKPVDFNSIGGNLQFRHEPITVKTKNIPPTKQRNHMDAIFFDVFHYFLNDTDSGSWLEAVTTVPGQEQRRDLSPLQNYILTITASSRTSDHAVGEFEWTMHQGQRPRVVLVESS